jgi:hypothetical protein
MVTSVGKQLNQLLIGAYTVLHSSTYGYPGMLPLVLQFGCAAVHLAKHQHSGKHQGAHSVVVLVAQIEFAVSMLDTKETSCMQHALIELHNKVFTVQFLRRSMRVVQLLHHK